MLPELSEKNVDYKSIAKKALMDEKVFSELLENITSKKETIRHNSFKVLLHLSEKHAEVLYPKWDLFADLLSSDNTYHKFDAIYFIANLTRVDRGNRFEKN